MNESPVLNEEQHEICRLAASLAGEAAIKAGREPERLAAAVVDAYRAAARTFREGSV